MPEEKNLFTDPTLTHLILNDQPIPPSILKQEGLDFLGTNDYSDQIIKIIKSHIKLHKESSTNDTLSTGFNMALYGSWGSGKTTLLYSIEDKLKEAGHPVCFFNPWKYENKSISTIFALLRQIEIQSGIHQTETNQEIHSRVDFWCQYITGSMFNLKDAKELRESHKDVNSQIYLNWIDNVELFSAQFSSFVKRITKDEPLVVFIDDLDRCTPDNALDLLQNIKNYLNVDNCIFIMGIDKEVLAKYITNKYNVDCFNGYQFLEKIFQYELNLPTENAKMEDVIQKFCDALEIKNIDAFKENFKDIAIPLRSFKRIYKRLYLTKLMFKDTDKQNMFNQPNILLIMLFEN